MDIDILATFDICFLNEHGANVMHWIGFSQAPDSSGAKFISSQYNFIDHRANVSSAVSPRWFERRRVQGVAVQRRRIQRVGGPTD